MTKDKVRMDYYLLDEDVYTLLKMVYRGKLDQSFAWDHLTIADNCYSRPFCSIATKKLGYDAANILDDIIQESDINNDILTQGSGSADI
jgi:hypothetical protein